MKKEEYSDALSLIEKAREWPENLGVGKPYDGDIRLENFIEAHCRKRMGEPVQAETLFKSVVATTAPPEQDRRSVHFIGALALRALDREKEARDFMQTWTDQQPDDITTRWAKAVFHHEYETAESILKSIKTGDRGTPWNPTGGDPDFRLVIDTVNMIEKLKEK